MVPTTIWFGRGRTARPSRTNHCECMHVSAMSRAVDRVVAVPMLGSGLGYRRELKDAIFESREAIDFLEVITEQFIGHQRQLLELEELCAAFTVIPHGIGLSIGS